MLAYTRRQFGAIILSTILLTLASIQTVLNKHNINVIVSRSKEIQPNFGNSRTTSSLTVRKPDVNRFSSHRLNEILTMSRITAGHTETRSSITNSISRLTESQPSINKVAANLRELSSTMYKVTSRPSGRKPSINTNTSNLTQQQQNENTNVSGTTEINPDMNKQFKEVLTAIDNSTHFETLKKGLEEAVVLTYSPEYRVVANILRASEVPFNKSETEITLCTQGSFNHIQHMQGLSQTWQGPISATIFANGTEILPALWKMAYLHTCEPSVRSFVNFHLVFPVSNNPLEMQANISKTEFVCDFSHMQSNLKPKQIVKNYKHGMPYPVNFLRTVSLINAVSPYVFNVDVDFIPSKNLHAEFGSFLKRAIQESKFDMNRTAFVVPSFESMLHPIKALTKQELLVVWKKNKVKPFYHRVCPKCQTSTDYKRWKDLPLEHQLNVSYIPKLVQYWEPFYIAKRQGLPLFDSRFKQFGKNRQSQV